MFPGLRHKQLKCLWQALNYLLSLQFLTQLINLVVFIFPKSIVARFHSLNFDWVYNCLTLSLTESIHSQYFQNSSVHILKDNLHTKSVFQSYKQHPDFVIFRILSVRFSALHCTANSSKEFCGLYRHCKDHFLVCSGLWSIFQGFRTLLKCIRNLPRLPHSQTRKTL